MSKFGYVCLSPNRFQERFGLCFEDVEVGMHIHHRPGVDISQQDNREESLDFINNAHLHYDSQYASQTEWDKPLFVSTITIQKLFGMISRSWYRRRAMTRIDSIVLSKPLFGGDTLYASTRVLSLDEGSSPDVGYVTLEIEGLNSESAVVARIKCTLEIYRRGRHPEDKPNTEIAEEPRFSLYKENTDGSLIEQTGVWFDDLKENETFVHWPGRTVTAAEIRTHALRSLEINPRWHDEAYLAAHPEIPQSVYEPMLIGIVTGLTTRSFGRVVANLGWTNIELPKPAEPGQTIYAESTILELRPSRSRPDQGLARVETRAYDEKGSLVCSYERALLIYRKGQGPYAAANY